MSRMPREHSASGYYHIIIRGVNRQGIFYDDQDRGYFLKLLSRYAGELGAVVVTYCLMTNHVHLLLACTQPDVFMKKMSAAYVYYFNHRYKRVGHLFQGRFKSEPVDDERYLLTVFRYILRNPEKAGICSTEEYRWSGFGELTGLRGFCDVGVVLCMFKDMAQLLQFVLEENDDQCLEMTEAPGVTEEEIRKHIREATGLSDPVLIRALPKAKRDICLLRCAAAGINANQLMHATGLSINTIRKVIK